MFVLTCYVLSWPVHFVQIFTEMACRMCFMDVVYERLMDHERWADEAV